MKIDMHCHTSEGSIDAKVGIGKYIDTLIEKGIDGMLITDHNSYRGYEHWKRENENNGTYKPFTVLKGIEYDTRNGGHILVILPEGISRKKTWLLEARGLSVRRLEQLVHSLGGILGPAHPFDTGYYAFMNTRFGRKHPEFLEKFDFIESFNSCAKPEANELAAELATALGKPQIAGSDTHRPEVIGTSYTIFDGDIKTTDDLIYAIKHGPYPTVPHSLLCNMHRDFGIVIEKLGIVGYWLYNRAEVLRYIRKRHRAIKQHFHQA